MLNLVTAVSHILLVTFPVEVIQICDFRQIGISAEQQSSLRKANIRPMASQQIHVRSVQPVRSSATEPRAMASIRPMAAAVLSSSSNISTPMATVMPTTAAMSESESTK